MKTVLIYRLGSLGDTIVALPAFHLITKAFPDAKRWVLTQYQQDAREALLPQILSGSGLVHGFIQYPLRTRVPHELLRIRREVRAFRPDVLVYLAEPRGRFAVFRDAAFFRWCGIRRLIGVPYGNKLRHRQQVASGLCEFEGSRLLRCLRSLGNADIDADGSFDLNLSEQERTAARSALSPLPPTQPMLALSIGAKETANDWGDANWSALLRYLDEPLRGWSVIMVGAAIEHERSARLLACWRGHGLNLCGKLSVREAAAALEHARLFVGHDSGPMHLAAAVGTTCVAIFSSKGLPGEWFPYGQRHRVLHPDGACPRRQLDPRSAYDRKGIDSIRVNDVAREIEAALEIASGNDAR